MFSITTPNPMPSQNPFSYAHDLQNSFTSHLGGQFSVGSQGKTTSPHVFLKGHLQLRMEVKD